MLMVVQCLCVEGWLESVSPSYRQRAGITVAACVLRPAPMQQRPQHQVCSCATPHAPALPPVSLQLCPLKACSHPLPAPVPAATHPRPCPYHFQVAGETVESSVLQLAAAKGQAEAARAQVALLQQRLRDKTATMLGGAAREAALQERLADLQALVDVSGVLGLQCGSSLLSVVVSVCGHK